MGGEEGGKKGEGPSAFGEVEKESFSSDAGGGERRKYPGGRKHQPYLFFLQASKRKGEKEKGSTLRVRLRRKKRISVDPYVGKGGRNSRAGGRGPLPGDSPSNGGKDRLRPHQPGIFFRNSGGEEGDTRNARRKGFSPASSSYHEKGKRKDFHSTEKRKRGDQFFVCNWRRGRAPGSIRRFGGGREREEVPIMAMREEGKESWAIFLSVGEEEVGTCYRKGREAVKKKGREEGFMPMNRTSAAGRGGRRSPRPRSDPL